MKIHARGRQMARILPRTLEERERAKLKTNFIEPRTIRKTVINIAELKMPDDVGVAIAEAFWSHIGIRPDRSIITSWFHLKSFARFLFETKCVKSLADVNSLMIVRYLAWLNEQLTPNGVNWTKSARAAAYSSLRILLQWISRCRPGVLSAIEFPYNPFPWRNRDTQPRSKMPTNQVRALLRACESDIVKMRAARLEGKDKRKGEAGLPGTLGWLLEQIYIRWGGIVPTAIELRQSDISIRTTLAKFGGLKSVEPYLYPRLENLLSYYLLILIHSAGNPEPIAELRRDCIQILPLLENERVLVWFKARANSMQRRTFSSINQFEPPILVQELLDWNELLIPFVDFSLRDRLFIYKGVRGVSTLNCSPLKKLLPDFCKRHGLPIFQLTSIRPGVLSSFYRVTGDIRRVGAMANHAHLSTTVEYVKTKEVKELNQLRIAQLQSAFMGHFHPREAAGTEAQPIVEKKLIAFSGPAVSMFGFDCADPFAGVAPGARKGELCAHFMGCFTCPNAVITSDPQTLGRLLQARDHLRRSAESVHPARWREIYAPQLRILEEDILTRFSSIELAAGEAHKHNLSPLPELR